MSLETTRPFSPLSTTCAAVVPGPLALGGVFIPAGGANRKREHQRVCTVACGGSLLFLRWFGGSGSLRSKGCAKSAVALCSCVELCVISGTGAKSCIQCPGARTSPCLLNLEWFWSPAAHGQPGCCVQRPPALTQGPLSPSSSPGGARARRQLLYPPGSSIRDQGCVVFCVLTCVRGGWPLDQEPSSPSSQRMK